MLRAVLNILMLGAAPSPLVRRRLSGCGVVGSGPARRDLAPLGSAFRYPLVRLGAASCAWAGQVWARLSSPFTTAGSGQACQGAARRGRVRQGITRLGRFRLPSKRGSAGYGTVGLGGASYGKSGLPFGRARLGVAWLGLARCREARLDRTRQGSPSAWHAWACHFWLGSGPARRGLVWRGVAPLLRVSQIEGVEEQAA